MAAARARHAILENFQSIDYKPTEETWRSVRMGVKRDLQAKRLRPNVAVPARKSTLNYLQVMYRETGSIPKAVASLFHDGTWTSSGGSFKLASVLGQDFPAIIGQRLAQGETCSFLEIGGGWAGFAAASDEGPQSIAGLARHFSSQLGARLNLHFTNLTPWHVSLPHGVREHPHVTAGALKVLTSAGVAEGSVDIIYSQAAAYFETDPASFVRDASLLLRPGGLLLFNYQEARAPAVLKAATEHHLALSSSRVLGGMNGILSAFGKQGSFASQGGQHTAFDLTPKQVRA